jgi:hypothetical protein
MAAGYTPSPVVGPSVLNSFHLSFVMRSDGIMQTAFIGIPPY